MTALATAVGAVIYAYYADIGCDPLASKQIGNPSQIVPFYIMDVLGYPGIPGLFMASLTAAALR